MARLTKYDIGRDIYVIKPDAPEGVSAIQKLGVYEDRDEARRSKLPFSDMLVCDKCGRAVDIDFCFCPDCGQRLIEEKNDDE